MLKVFFSQVPHPGLTVYAADFAPKAIDVIKEHELFDPKRTVPFVLDMGDRESWRKSPLASPSPTANGESASETPLDASLERLTISEAAAPKMDMISMIFSLSALEPGQMGVAVEESFRALKPGGMLFFRDYGRYDMAQVRDHTGCST